ncbi:MAG: cation acetate symporter [Candidatus Sumerlaeaceae bacterium]
MIQYIPLFFVILIVVATIALGIWATRMSKTASDFFVAGRSVNVFWNSSAISGEYLSAASFMGVAGLIMKFGYDALWYPVCFAAGYLFLLLFIAGPLRRFGAYTIPDFAEGRFDSPMFRKVAVTFVLFIGFFYTMPQMKGAGITMQQILNWPYWAGIVAVGAIITFNVALGGMKGITFVQAFQYWAKMFAISVPVFVLMSVLGGYHTALDRNVRAKDEVPQMTGPVTVAGPEKAPANTLAFYGPSTFTLSEASALKFNQPIVINNRDGVQTIRIGNEKFIGEHRGASEVVQLPAGTRIDLSATDDANVKWTKSPFPIKCEFQRATRLNVESGAIPNAPRNGAWLSAYGPFTNKSGYPLLYTYSLIIGLICGTAGLPHILVRFYTNPDGRSAKRTTLWVMVLIGVFYMFPPIWGALGRIAMPNLYLTPTGTDRVVIALPGVLQSELWGKIWSGITSAGAFAAFMSTFSGLLVSMSGALAHDIYGRMLKPDATPQQRVTAFKFAAVLFGAISIGLGITVETFDISKLVGWAFAIAAASYFPLLLMGSWWRGLTKFGAGSGMLIGGLLSLGAIVTTMLIDTKVITLALHPLARTLMEQPAIWGVPLAIILMVVVSKMTAAAIPADVDVKMLRLHAPEETGFSKNYIEH